MAKLQSRRSISFARLDFEAAHAAAGRLKVPLAQLAAQAVRELVARNPDPAELVPPRPIADQVVIEDLPADSPFRRPCKLIGCAAAPGQACRPVPRDGGEDPELAVERVHENRLWQAWAATVECPTQPGDSAELAAALQRKIDDRVGVLPRASGKIPPPSADSFTLDDARRVVAEVSKPGYQAQRGDSLIDEMIAASSVGAGLRNIEEHGLDAELADLDEDLADHSDEVRVVYDEDAR